MSQLFFSHPVSDPMAANREMLRNALTSRQGFFEKFFDKRRDLDSECGYPSSTSSHVNAEAYRELYDRMPVARRVVELMPKECWQVQPLIYETEDPEDETEFEKAWDNLAKTLRGEQSWYQDETGSPVWEYLKRADILSGIGSFGVILLGIDDGLMLDQPVAGVVATMQDADGNVRNKFPSSPVVNSKLKKDLLDEEQILLNNYIANRDSTDSFYNYGPYGMGTAAAPSSGVAGVDAQYVGIQMSPSEQPSTKASKEKRNLLFMRCFDESMVQIVQYEADLRNPRFGKPVMYRITLNDPRELQSGIGLSTATIRVHWSRVIHIADNLQSSEIFGCPRMRPVLNDLLDLRKIYGASAEGYWKSCFSILQFSTHPQLGGDVDVDIGKIKDTVDNVNNSLQRDVLGIGGVWSTIAPQVVDPTPHIQVRMNAIALYLGCPMRIFMGSEQGVLAGDQDGISFYLRRVPERQLRTITPRQIIPLVDRLIQIGVLPEPKIQKDDFADDTGGETVDEDEVPIDNMAPGTYRRVRTRYVRVFNADTGAEEIQTREVGSTVIKTTGGYSIEWPDMDAMTEKDKAAILLQRTQAYSAYVSGGLEALIPPHEYMTEFDSVPDARARQIIDAAAEAHELQDTMTTAPMMGGRPMAPEEGQEGWEPPEPPPEFAENAAADPLESYIDNRFCKTGEKGGVDPTCGKGGAGGKKNHMSEKALRAQGSAKRVDKEIQRYAEEHNEPLFAQAIGGLSFKDNEPVDIVVGDASGRVRHGVELKTMVDNGNNKITMKQSAMQRKAKWERSNRATFHTVVFDDTQVYNAKGQGQHDVSKRRIFYRRGFGSFRVGTMHEVKSMKELKQLMDTPNKKLPDAARRKN